jgi:Skp family chaperone for outer membrane proteins
MRREERLEKIRKELQDFERCLNEANGNVAVAFDRWLESWRMLGVVEAIGYWVNMGWTEEEVRRELEQMFQLIDEELAKIKSEG